LRRGAGTARAGRAPIPRPGGLLPLSGAASSDRIVHPIARYVGRFAPSPTGPLHIGSLLTAVASFLHARQAGGRWLVRIDDIDPPRTIPGASDAILRALEAYALHWDSSPLYQSTRLAAYAEAAGRLRGKGSAYDCSCTRRDLASFGGRYPGTCRTRGTHLRRTALRVRVDADSPGAVVTFLDGLQGLTRYDLPATSGDYVIVRRDGLPAYHLACAIDDAWQQVTDVVRGVDLLESTGVHVHLQGLLGLPTPRYFHLPVIVNEMGAKLSKQTGAAPIETTPSGRSATATRVLALLGLEPPVELHPAPPAELWAWALEHWNMGILHGQRALRGAS
jgi:glutamyl-Q tRNA(Asp) synthetase